MVLKCYMHLSHFCCLNWPWVQADQQRYWSGLLLSEKQQQHDLSLGSLVVVVVQVVSLPSGICSPLLLLQGLETLPPVEAEWSESWINSSWHYVNAYKQCITLIPASSTGLGMSSWEPNVLHSVSLWYISSPVSHPCSPAHCERGKWAQLWHLSQFLGPQCVFDGAPVFLALQSAGWERGKQCSWGW